MTEQYGPLELRVQGRRDWFKSRWDYGTTRFAMRRDSPEASQWVSAHWFPHAYVLEDVDPETGMPFIHDQERASMVISIGNPYRTLPSAIMHTEIGLTTQNGEYDVLPNKEEMWTYMLPTHIDYNQAMLKGQINPQRRMLADDLNEAVPGGRPATNENDHKDLAPIQVTPREIWVPVAALRSGNVYATLDLSYFA